MKILLLSCSTGEGHNHCALAVKEALDARGHETSFLDMLHMFGAPGPLSFDKILNRISTKAPDVFGMMYHAGAMYSATGVTSPVYMANIRHARQLNAFIRDNGYDAVVCSHLFPMETLTFLRRWERCEVKCCGILSDYTCIPFLAETDLDAYFLPHNEVRELCIQAGMPAEKLIVSGMPVAARFLAPMDKAAARAALGLPADKKIYLIMTGGIGCGDAVSLCDAIRRVPDENALLCVLPGRNEALRGRLSWAGRADRAVHGSGAGLYARGRRAAEQGRRHLQLRGRHAGRAARAHDGHPRCGDGKRRVLRAPRPVVFRAQRGRGGALCRPAHL